MTYERTRFSKDDQLRDLHVLLRMSGKTQTECATILGMSRATISLEEQSERYQDKMIAFASIIAKLVLPPEFHDHFGTPETERNDLERIRKGMYV